MIKTPTFATLKRYGLSLQEWRALLESQGGVCFVCRKEPTQGRLCIDHEHVAGWAKMPPAKRKLFVRGLLCWFCNHYYLGRSLTLAKAREVVSYLERYRDWRGSPGGDHPDNP